MTETKKIKVIVNTKSNYRGLNGDVLTVKEVVGTRVSCNIIDEMGRTITADFNKSEVCFLDSNIEMNKMSFVTV